MAWTSSRLPTEGRFPSLAGATGWRHSPPLEPAGLREKVVLVDFCTFTCINWLRTLSYVRAWDQSYRDQGLVVIGLHTPEFSFGHDLENIRRALASMAIDYPIAVDNDYAVWDAFANHYWPALYFIDAEGSIRHHWFGEGDYERSEAVIQQLLRDAGVNDVGDELVAIDPVGPEVGADWDNLGSPETYLGTEKARNFASKRVAGGLPAGTGRAIRSSIRVEERTGTVAPACQTPLHERPGSVLLLRFPRVRPRGGASAGLSLGDLQPRVALRGVKSRASLTAPTSIYVRRKHGESAGESAFMKRAGLVTG
jgi:hypothetical protein